MAVRGAERTKNFELRGQAGVADRCGTDKEPLRTRSESAELLLNSRSRTWTAVRCRPGAVVVLVEDRCCSPLREIMLGQDLAADRVDDHEPAGRRPG